MIRKLTFCLYCFVVSGGFYAQKRTDAGNKEFKQIEIIHADVLKYNKFINANKLIGNVICKHENTLFYCDSAYLYSNQSFRAFGNIRIVSDSLSITAQSLFYDAFTKLVSLEKNVVCNDNKISLKTEILQYNTHTHLAFYPKKADIIRNEHHLTSEKGYYYSNEKILAFKHNVVLTNPDYVIKTDTLLYYTGVDIVHFNAPTIILMDRDYLYCEKGWYDTRSKKAYFSKNPMLFSDNRKLYADSLYYNENTKHGYAFNNIRLIDTSQKTVITGNFAEYNMLSENAMITKYPVLKKIHEQKDTIFLTADTLYYQKKDSNVIAKCINNTQLFHSQFQAIAKNIVYCQKDSVIHLIGSPKFWFGKNQANSKFAELYLKNNSIGKIILDTNVIIMQEADSVFHNKYHQISGRKMQINFQNDSIKNILIEGNAQIYYFLSNDEKKWTGLNKVRCSKIRIDFLDNEIYKIVFIDHPESIIIPMKKIQLEKEKLPNFQWQPKLRPQRKNFL